MGIQKTNVEVSRGEFVQPAPTASSPFTQTHKYHIMRDPTISFSCVQADIAPLTLSEYKYLNRAEVIPDKRYEVYEHMITRPDIVALAMRGTLKSTSPPLALPERPASFAPSIGTTVLVPSFGVFGASYYGVVKWIGQFEGRDEKMAGIELVKKLCLFLVLMHVYTCMCGVSCF